MPPAYADPQDRWERRQEKLERGLESGLVPGGNENRLGAKEAARLAQERNGGGRVLDVVPSNGGWRVKLLKNGEVRMVIIEN